jgi:monofunctional biosynthetic peptidoglycan transglycosylase
VRRRRRRRGAIVSVGRLLLAVVIAWLGLCALGLVYLRYFPPVVTALQVQRLVEQGERPGSRTGFVPLASLGPYLPRAAIAAEDARFYQHHGLDWDGMRQAAEDNVRRGRMWRGGSTITQQLVKNLFLTTHGSVLRKMAEIPLSVLAEAILPKQRILELYLNVVEFGPGIYGAQAAAEHYYGVPANELNREQAARLIACLPAPRTRKPERMNAYSAKILRRMSAVE